MAILTLETKQYAIKIDKFEGPLDLLCHLIDVNKMDIYDINIKELIEYKRDGTLLYLKSKKLLPKQEDEQEELTEEELIQRIIDYKKYKEISKTLKEHYIEYSNRVFKGQEEITLPKQKVEFNYDAQLIPNLYKDLVKRTSEKINVNAKNIEKIALVENYSVSSKVKEMYKTLIKQKRFIFNKLFSIKKRNKQEVVTAFSGLLEMSRRSKVETTQEELFGDITVEKRKRA